MIILPGLLAMAILAGAAPLQAGATAEALIPMEPVAGPVTQAQGADQAEVATPATGEPAAAPAGAAASRPIEPRRDSPFSLSASRLTGDWGGLRPTLEEHGVTASIFLNDQRQAVVKGGTDTGGSGRNSASMDALITFDLEKLKLVPQADVLLHLQANWGEGINPRTGALFQVNDDADGSIGGHVAQFWYRHHFWQRKASLMIGYLDYQTIVDRNAYANSEDKQFMHLTLDNNPLVPLRIGMGAALTLRPVDWYALILGIADGQAVPYKGGISKAFHEEDWYTAYAENGFQVKIPGKHGPLPGNYRVGMFYDPGPRKKFPRSPRDDGTMAGDYGFYASLDQLLHRETEQDDQGLGVFARFGYRNPEANRMSRFWSGGVSYKGLIPGRNEDVLGAAFSCLRSSHLYRDRVNDSFTNETVYEVYYAVQVSKWMVLTPDFQYIDNPGAAGEYGHAIVAGVRARVSF